MHETRLRYVDTFLPVTFLPESFFSIFKILKIETEITMNG